MADKTIKKIEEIFEKWIDKIYPSKKEFKKVLKSKKVIIYHGVDPTAPHLHLGHSTNLLFLRELQQLGHKIILLVGDFTAQIGDPTGRLSPRKPLSRKEILVNFKNYKKQAGKILNFNSKKNPAQIKFNSQWFSKFKLEELIRLAAYFTVGQIIKRNMFQERIKKKEEIYLHEFLYPLFQGYDSVALNIDVEVGGTDQTFNMLVGRDLVRIYRNKEKFVITTPLLINPKTQRKIMSKSEGEIIALDDSPDQMYGKIMALPDEVILTCFELCTTVPLLEIKKMRNSLNRKKINPRDLKARLAREIVGIYYGKKATYEAEKEFERIFKEKKFPTEIPTILMEEKNLNILDLLVKTKLAPSKSEAKRLVLQRGVRITGKAVDNWKKTIKIKSGLVLQVGKRNFIKIK